MTEQEAIKHLLDISSDMPSMECKYWIESIKLAIAALEKQITKKPNKKNDVMRRNIYRALSNM